MHTRSEIVGLQLPWSAIPASISETPHCLRGFLTPARAILAAAHVYSDPKASFLQSIGVSAESTHAVHCWCNGTVQESGTACCGYMPLTCPSLRTATCSEFSDVQISIYTQRVHAGRGVAGKILDAEKQHWLK